MFVSPFNVALFYYALTGGGIAPPLSVLRDWRGEGHSPHSPPIRFLNMACLLLTGWLRASLRNRCRMRRADWSGLWSFRAPRTMSGNKLDRMATGDVVNNERW